MADNNKTEEFSWNEELRSINESLSEKGAADAAKDSSLEWTQDLKDLNLDLEARILEANNDATKVKWSKLLPDLMAAEILMVGQFTDQVDESGNKVLNIVMMQKNGHVIVPFFTNPSRISVLVQSQRAQFDVMKVNTVRFFQSVMGKSCVLNPMSDYSRVFTPFEVKVLAAENIDKAPPIPGQEEEAAEA